MFENSGDPARPFGGHYEAFDYDFVPWYASWSFRERISYLDWIIALRQAEVDTWKAAQDPRDWGSEFRISEHHESSRVCRSAAASRWLIRRPCRLGRGVSRPTTTTISTVHAGNGNEFASWCRRSGDAKPRVAVPADECHHLSYDRLGFEENADLAALCVGHHQMAHGRRWSDPEVA